MSDIDHRYKSVKCKCGNFQFNLSYNHYKGGDNDRGGIIAKCPKCGSYTAIRIQNPGDIYGLNDGAEIENKWYDDMPNDYYSRYNLSAQQDAIEASLDFVNDMTQKHNHYQTASPIEDNEILSLLKNSESIITDCYNGIYHYYIKGRTNFNSSFVIIHDKDRYLVFGKSIDTENDLNPNSLILINDSSINYNTYIDGIYSRDEARHFVETMLCRWKLTSEQVVVATPFIGFSYNEKQLNETLQLWEWLDSNIDINKTTFITRKSSFNTMVKHLDRQMYNSYPILQKWGLLDDLKRECSHREHVFTQNFHAKIYAGIFADHVELLSGSYNIHTGSYLENLCLRNLSREHFLLHYMNPLCTAFRYQKGNTRRTHVIDISSEGEVIQNNEISMTEFLTGYCPSPAIALR